jgi:hypothetical protein
MLQGSPKQNSLRKIFFEMFCMSKNNIYIYILFFWLNLLFKYGNAKKGKTCLIKWVEQYKYY